MSIWNRLAPKWFRNSKGRLNRIPQPRLEFLEDRTNPSALLQKFLSPQPGAFQVNPAPQQNNPNIVFVDSQLLNQVPQKELSGSQVIVIDSNRDAISQIDQALSDLHGIQTLRLISHGQDGAILFGNQVINQNVLNARSTEISAWRSALAPGADILVYGCSVATTSTGRQFVDTISNLTGADAAASSNPTGYKGDLTLEYKHGSIQAAPVASMADWTRSGLQLILPNQNIGSGASFYAGTGQQFPNRSAFAVLKTDGSIAAWGLNASGGTGAPTGSSFVQIFSNSAAFAALKSDGSIVGWGSNSASSAPTGTGYTSISSTATAFAALKSDGSISAWGASATGGTGAPTGTGFTAIYSNASAFAAIKSDGSISVWGASASGATGAPTATGFVRIYSTSSAFAALSSTGTISVWGDTANGGDQSAVPTGTGYTAIYSTEGAFAAFKNSSTAISAWGNASFGATGAPTGTGFTSIAATGSAFAAINSGAITCWGNSAAGGFVENPITGVSTLYSNRANFAGVKTNGQVVYWGSLSSVGATITGTFAQVYSTETAFTAQDSNGTLLSFGDTTNGGTGNPTVSGYTQLYASTTAFSALKTDGSIVSWGTNSTTAPAGTSNLVLQSALITKPYFAPNRTTSYTGVATQSFSQSFAGIGFDITYSVSSGSLPAGLSLNSSTGVVSGTPTTGQTSNFTITGTNAQGSASQAYSITINVATTTTLTSSLNPSTYGTSVTFTATVTSNPTGINAGTVTFYDGVTSIGTSSVNGSGIATLATSSVSSPAPLSAGTHSISAVYNGSGFWLTSTSNTVSQVVNQKTLTVTGTTASNKTYDGTTTATINTGGSTLVGRVDTDDVALVTSGATGTFANANIGTGKTVTIAGMTLSGTAASNYTLTQPTTTANITAKELTVTGTTASNKVYDGNTTATINTGSSALVGVVGSDDVTLVTGGATGAFSSKTVGTGKTVTVSGMTLSGGGAGNYTLTQPTTTANITAKELTVTGTTASNKVYDATTAATLNTSSSALSGVVSGDTVNLGGTPVGTFASANVGSAIVVSILGFTISGDDSGNYSLTQPSTTANITKANQTITWATPSPISLGTALSSTQLNASVSGVVGGSDPGALSYDMPLGTVLPTGANTVTVTAAATSNYNSASLSRTITVNAYFADPNPSLGNGFGTTIVTLTGGNVVITAPFDDAGATDAGAVYLYSGITGQLLSTLKGSHANDNIGSGGVTALANGNFVILSPLWDSDTATDVGAVTFGTATSGVSGFVSSTNSLVGSTSNDSVGQYAILALKNGNYVVPNPLWNNGSTVDAGAVTFGSGSSGVSGVISSTNSLVGSHTSDMVGSTGLTELTNGNFVVRSSNWNSASGAVTWSSGTTGVTGVVGVLNSIYGSTDNDLVGSSPITALSNGNFIISSPHWHNGLVSDAGAATWVSGVSGKTRENAFGEISTTNSLVGTATGDSVGSDGAVGLINGNFVVVSASWSGVKGAVTFGNGNSGLAGAISSSNSLVGDAAGANIGSGGVTALANSNYVVKSINWSSNKGAVTFGNGVTGTTGVTGSGTSLVGTTNNSYVGSSGVTELSNGNYVVGSALWNGGVGAATFASGTTAITGAVSSSNSLVGSQSGDQVGAKVTALKNNNYVVVSSSWANGTSTAAGAVTWGSGSSGVTGPVSSTNSLVGSSQDDQLGSGGITELASNNFVVASPMWNNGATVDAGAVTWGNGGSGTSGVVGVANSLVGSTANDKVGSVVTALTNGNYVAVSATWDNGAAGDAGAVTLLTGSERGTVGAVSSTNSLVGTQTDDHVGFNGITVLSNSNFVVVSSQWNNGGTGHAGAVTWVSGTSGLTGPVTSTNSLVGTTANDQLGSGGVTALASNGNYVVSSPLWDGAAANVGAVTWGNGADGSTKGAVTITNSLVGSTAEDSVGSGGVTALTSGNYLVKSTTWSNGTLSNAGAVTWGRGTTGVAGAVSSTNSTVGVVANATLGAITLNAGGGSYLVSFLSDGSGPRVNYGFQDPTAPTFTSATTTTFTSGAAGSFTFTATGSPTPAFSIVSGSLPTGLTLNNTTGVLSGTTTQVGTYNLTIRATNGLGVTTDQAFTLEVVA